MAIFTLADLHLSLGEDKPMDVFGGKWNRYHEKLEEYWNYMVADEDTVIIPGDVSWAMSLDEAVTDFAFLHKLAGKKILMKGNHDYWWTTLNKMEVFLQEQGFSTLSILQNTAVLAENKVICGSRGWICENNMSEEDEKILARENQRFILSLTAAKALAEKNAVDGVQPEIIAFSHYPLISQSWRKHPIVETLCEFGVKRVYYGHLHGISPGRAPRGDERLKQTLVSSDYLEFTPLCIE